MQNKPIAPYLPTDNSPLPAATIDFPTLHFHFPMSE